MLLQFMLNCHFSASGLSILIFDFLLLFCLLFTGFLYCSILSFDLFDSIWLSYFFFCEEVPCSTSHVGGADTFWCVQSSNAVVTTDRDNKVRCSTLPPNPLEGSYEIKAYCLGHNAFVTSSSFAVWDKREVLVTGGGDGQVIVWNYETGQALAKYQVPKVEHNKSSNGSDEVPGEYCEENTTEQEGLNLKQEQSSNLRVKGESQMESGNVILSLSTAPTQ